MSNFLLVLVVGLHFIVIIKCNKNNVCPTFRDYYNKETNPRCWHDPDVFSDAIDILNRYKYNYEVYTAITPDGYILNVYRLPPKKNKSKGLVFLSHCATCNMIVWIDKGNQSMAFVLVEAGYDVWLGNFRGTLYSQQHVTLSRTHQPEQYYNYSFHEMGIYDTPTQLELVRNVSGSTSKIYFIGHSLGTTVAFVYASMLPKHANEYINLFILWAPAIFFNTQTGFIRYLVPFGEIISKIITLNNLTNIFAYNNVTVIFYYICLEFLRLPETCNTILDEIFGLDPENVSPLLYPACLIHNGYSFPAKGFEHYSQMYASSRFQWFDYGKKNKYYYNSRIPPEYPIENISTPTYIFYGTTDLVASLKETLHIFSMLRPEVRYGMTEVGYNHVNFMYGKDLYKNLYLPTINIIDNFQNNKS